MNIVFVGAGRVATSLSLALAKAGHHILQVYSRTETSAKALADRLGADYTTDIDKLVGGADVYIIALTDTALSGLASWITQGREDCLFVHTAGSMSIDTLTCRRRGVFYPMQTFSLERLVDFEHVPCFVEASSDSDQELLRALASSISGSVYALSSCDRMYLHLAAVFCCNFSNHCYAIAERLLQEHGVPFEVMLPLIDETAAKAHTMSPVVGQTGPAARNDHDVMRRQELMLSDKPVWQQIYRLMSQDIQNFSGNSEQSGNAGN
ncbi:MAG: DUF2520 domain-containing protein [Bacteroidaceae bacterium]|nr:DUF2520 domain-containing protein [Bacteroidaceae bacterium]